MKRYLLAMLTLFLISAGAAGQTLERRPPLREAEYDMHRAKFDSSHSYDTQSYSLDISLPLSNDSLYGHLRLGALSREDNLSLAALDAVNMTIDSVRCQGRDTSFQYNGTVLGIGLPGVAPGGHFTLDVFYRLGGRGADRIGYYWYPRKYNTSTLHAVAYSMAEPQDSRYWMPCFDDPWDKADSGCAIAVAVSDSYSVASNGTFQDTVRSGDRLTWSWREDFPVSTYLMCFTVSRFAFWSDTAHMSSGRPVPLNYFMWPEDSVKSRAVFATVPGMVRMLDSLFHDYAFDKYGMAAVYPFDYGGMEHQTMTTIHRDWIPGNDQLGILHELAHQWFGDMVTCGTWADIWLNEGFASYCEAIYDSWLNHRLPGNYMIGNFSNALSGNANTYPIYEPPPGLIFDGSMEYSKGAWVLQGLRWVMGDPLFFPMMRAYADSFAYGNAVTADFQRIAEHHYGSSLQWYFDQWVYRAGHPSYTTIIYYKTHPDSNAARVILSQSSTTGDLYKMPLALACSTSAGADSTFVVWDSLATETLSVASSHSISRLMLDPDNWVLKEYVDLLPRLRAVLPGLQKLTPVWYHFNGDIAGYNLYRSLSSAGPFARLNPAPLADTTYVDTGLTGGLRYYYAVTAVDAADTCRETRFSNIVSRVPTGVEGGGEPQVTDGGSKLEQNRPNPFISATFISYQLATGGRVSLKVYNAAGQLVRVLADKLQGPGSYNVGWDGRDEGGRHLSAGLYFYRLKAGGASQVRRLVLVK
jgi:aminopeptidase N